MEKRAHTTRIKQRRGDSYSKLPRCGSGALGDGLVVQSVQLLYSFAEVQQLAGWPAISSPCLKPDFTCLDGESGVVNWINSMVVELRTMNQVYGFGGIGMVVEVLTDKVTRSAAAVRGVTKDCGAKLADPGSILFKFRRAQAINIKANAADKDQLLTIALDAGAEDVIEPPESEDDSEEDRPDRYFQEPNDDILKFALCVVTFLCFLKYFTICIYYKIVTSSENYSSILSKLRDEGIGFEPDNSFELLPFNPIEVHSSK
ncbi:hypothetical protein ZIOFF_012949 [Zingiber officinale]|uniref:TACO1/YebC-like second and third domain-containing protein n=1 Tax=Zingiber officinale TaxID=94328 RepID=A0A8J5LTT2_ZINOF|nr:hypothetical protein ZIOFF_012949 [Zingiber officinale]